MEKYNCIHGHIYQPPRENPWLEDIELQDSAYPYHDWNERVCAECYAPNTASRILDAEGRILRLPNNYAKISFDFGPTLLAWMARKAPEIYEAILAADRVSQKNFSGHGSALAQAYNHMIMPLANRRDKYTQVLWGIQDFSHRFGRPPEGMWLPETAVDLETLDIMAELGIAFTILCPTQAKQVRLLEQGNWMDVSEGRIDPTMAYALNLPSRRRINIFFYDGPISRAVAFEGLLSRGENLAQRLTGAFSDERQWGQLVHIATDGETYGHHQRHGDMALTYALQYLEEYNLARLTNYGEYLEKYPPTHEVEIFENTSWSCGHGVERWRSDCGCNTGSHPGWNQAWRGPLREAMDWLRDELARIYEEQAGGFLNEPWAAREAMVHTRWVSPQLGHEEALLGFWDRILDEAGSPKFLEDFRQFQARLAWYGALNSLSQVVLKAAAPGVPDFYQGTELWDFSLVDPDNRRPVDFDRRVRFLKEMKQQEEKKGKALISRMLSKWQDGRLKLYLTHRALNLRKSHAELFLEGDYLPLAARGERNRHVVALGRRRQGDWVVAATGRFFAGLAAPGQLPVGRDIWGETGLVLPRGTPGRWTEIFSGEERQARRAGARKILPLHQIFQPLPVALLLGSA